MMKSRPVTLSTLRAVLEFRHANSGGVAIIFALLSLPLLFMAGAAIDYMRYSAAKAQLDANLDGAILSIVSQKSNDITKDQQSRLEKAFRDEAKKLPDVSIVEFTSEINKTKESSILKASYRANVETTIAKMMNITSLPAKGTASAERGLSKYIDFYLLLDNSPSMGLAATPNDVAKLQSLTPRKCAFACHQFKYDKSGKAIGDDPNSYYAIAMRNNVKLRIHVLRDAVMNLVESAKSAMELRDQYRMEIWTFSQNPTLLSQLTANLDRVKAEAVKIDMVPALNPQTDNQTSYERALPKMTSVIPASSDGNTSTTPVRFLFFVTDGVQDAPVDGSVSNPGDGFMITANRFISPINPALCRAMKDRGISIGIIYTTYLPLYAEPFYNKFVKPFETRIPKTLESCASPGLFFAVATGGDINAAMQALFATAVNQVRMRS